MMLCNINTTTHVCSQAHHAVNEAYIKFRVKFNGKSAAWPFVDAHHHLNNGDPCAYINGDVSAGYPRFVADMVTKLQVCGHDLHMQYMSSVHLCLYFILACIATPMYTRTMP